MRRRHLAGLNVRRAFAGLAIALLGAGLMHPAAAVESASSEYAVKAAYLSKFGLFVDWPKSAFTSPTSAIVVCVTGDNPFGDMLDKVVSGQRIGDRPIEVRYLKSVSRNPAATFFMPVNPASSRWRRRWKP